MPDMPSARSVLPFHCFWRRPLCLAPSALQPYLCETGSLTARLGEAFPAVRVRVLYEGRQAPLLDEMHMLRQPRQGMLAAVREVLLETEGVPLVFAHSVAPRVALRGGFRLLGRVGPRPLGALLFARPTYARSSLSWHCIDRRHPLWLRAEFAVGPLPPRLWARRSLFFSGRDRLLVTEVFLPAMTFA